MSDLIIGSSSGESDAEIDLPELSELLRGFQGIRLAGTSNGQGAGLNNAKSDKTRPQVEAVSGLKVRRLNRQLIHSSIKLQSPVTGGGDTSPRTPPPKYLLRSRPQYTTSPYVYEISPTPSPDKPSSASLPSKSPTAPPAPVISRRRQQTTNTSGSAGPTANNRKGLTSLSGIVTSDSIAPRFTENRSKVALSPGVYTPKRSKRPVGNEENENPFFDPTQYPVLFRNKGEGPVKAGDEERLSDKPTSGLDKEVVSDDMLKTQRETATAPLDLLGPTDLTVAPLTILDIPLIDLTTLPQTPRRPRGTLAISPFPSQGRPSTALEADPVAFESAVEADGEGGLGAVPFVGKEASEDAGVETADSRSPTGVPQRADRRTMETEDKDDSREVIRRARKKRVVYSSDEEEDAAVSTGCLGQSPARIESSPEIIIIGGEPQRNQPRSRVLPRQRSTLITASKRGVSRYIEAEALGSGGDDEDEDDSEGSLRDFIVDDDEVEYEEDVVSGSEDDGHGDDSDCVLHYSPPRRLKKRETIRTSEDAILVVDSSEDEPSTSTPDQRARPRPRPKILLPPETPAKPSRAQKKDWAERRVRLANELMMELDESVFDCQLVGKYGVEVEWSERLLTTAGRANWKK
jgi:hypothetical protein